METAILIILAAVLLVTVVWVERSCTRAMNDERAKFAESIKHLRVEQQAKLWIEYIRDESRRL